MRSVLLWTAALLLTLGAGLALALPVPTTLDDFFLPGSQPGNSGNLESPDKCDNCHGGYDTAVEPAFNWRGSMMSQAARDPLFFACVAIANQDAPQSGDLCIRCHTPDGWLGGRSVPTDGSALTLADREGVTCDFCHKAVKPWLLGDNPYANDPDYTAGTYAADQGYLGSLTDIPPTSGNGMYVADSANAKRGPFVDAVARHQMYYSPFHQEAYLCGTCHDVSNPAFTKDTSGNYVPNDFGAPAPDFDPYSMFPIERTFSEWLMSAYSQPGGVYAPQFGGNKAYVSTCQDCHMKDVTGVGCNKRGAPVRSDLPLHDMTGGNTFIPGLVAQMYPDQVNLVALNAGVQRARGMLKAAASLDVTVTDQGSGYQVDVRVTNETGHKLPSGYPEGRRIWINVKAVDFIGNTLYESAAYDVESAELSHDADAKIYEIKPGISADLSPVVGVPEGPSFHFVVNNEIFKDNRIPPRGFTNANFEAIQSPPVNYAYPDGQYWDDSQYLIPAGTAQITVTLYYQTLSKEYVTFLRDANVTNDAGQVLYDLWAANGKSAPEIMAQQVVTLGTLVDTEPPTAPSNLAANALSSSRIALAWDASTDNIGVTGYRVVRDGTLVADLPGRTFTDTGLAASTTYTYYVTAYDEAGNVSANSNTASATTQKKGGGGGGKPSGIASRVMLAPDRNPVVDGAASFSFYLPEPGAVEVNVYDLAGRRVAQLVDGWRDGGHHDARWDASTVASGVYVVQLVSDQETITRKVTIVR